MTVKPFLIFAPIVVILVLLQSYLWVPTYEEQTRGNPERLQEYITASSGDASLLNPVLSSDSASSQIESLVFEGLVDRDQDLHFRGRLATYWEIYEEAFFFVNEWAHVPNLGITGASQIANLIREAKKNTKAMAPRLKTALEGIRGVSIIPPRDYVLTRLVRDRKDKNAKRSIRVHIHSPARIKLTLKKVNQALFPSLGLLIGKKYFASFRGEPYISTEPAVEEKELSQFASELLPATEHNPVIVFHLRPNVRFHDGHLLTAKDVRFTYESIMNPRNLSPRISDYEPVKRLEIIDSHTVRIVYKRLYSPALGTWGMGILPEHLLDREALRKEAIRLGRKPEGFTLRDSQFNRHPVGCGPFVFREWKSDRYIVLERFEKYWEGPPNYNRYFFRVIPDLLTQEMEFYAGTIDSYGVQPHQVKRLEKDARFQHFSGASFGYTYIGYNMRRPPFNDIRVRKALSMAIDVDRVINYVLYGQGERITGPFVKQTDYYNHLIRPVPYDPQGALRLLEEAGWHRNRKGWLEKDGKRLQFTLITNSGNDLRKAILAIAQDAWKQLGIEVRTDLLEWSVFIQERVNKLDFDALILGWQMGIDPDLYQIWHSSQTQPYQLNFVGFKNEEADDLIIKIRQEYDHDRQVQYCHRLHKIIAREQPYTFLYVSKWTAILDKRIVIKEIGPQGNVVYKKITPTKTGDYSFYFNRWVKLPEVPYLIPEG